MLRNTPARSNSCSLASNMWKNHSLSKPYRTLRTKVRASSAPRGPDSNPLMEAVSYGQAALEVVSERLEAVLTLENVLAELGKANAEMMQTAREFQEEVSERAQQHLLDLQDAPPDALLPLPLPGPSSQSSSGEGGSSSSGGSSRSSRGGMGRRRGGRSSAAQQKEAEELAELVDNVRADVAAARAALRQLKAQQRGVGGRGT